MLRTSIRNLVRMTVLLVVVLAAGSAVASEAFPNLQKPDAPQGIGVWITRGSEVPRQIFFSS